MLDDNCFYLAYYRHVQTWSNFQDIDAEIMEIIQYFYCASYSVLKFRVVPPYPKLFCTNSLNNVLCVVMDPYHKKSISIYFLSSCYVDLPSLLVE